MVTWSIFPLARQDHSIRQTCSAQNKYSCDVDRVTQEFDKRLTWPEEEQIMFKVVEDPFAVTLEEVATD